MQAPRGMADPGFRPSYADEYDRFPPPSPSSSKCELRIDGIAAILVIAAQGDGQTSRYPVNPSEFC